jgi:galactoside 2-L-fucosyltransferase 1/2
MSNSLQVNLTEHPCERIRCAVILRSSGGRLGNRMFMFASAYGLARTHHCRLHVSDKVNHDLFGNFQMASSDETIWLSKAAVDRLKDIRVEYNVCSYIPSLMLPKAIHNFELSGYWQSYLYFDAYRDEIRQFFTGRGPTLIRLASYFTGLLTAECPLCAPLPSGSQEELRRAFRTRYNITWVSIHIRRSDFRGLGFTSDDSYVRQAMLHFRRRYHSQKVRFLVASDDKRFCNDLFSDDQRYRKVFVLPEDFPPAEDLISLSLCHHSIVSGGTYSFWSAYLTGGDVIHDIRYSSGCTPAEYYPPWFMLIAALIEKKPSAG